MDLSLNEGLISQIVRKYLFPFIFAQVTMKLCLLINAVILGRMLGDAGLSTIIIVAPVDFVLMAIGAMISIGASINSSIALGRGEREKANCFYTLALTILVIVGTVISVTGFVFAAQLAGALGATEQNMELVTRYLRFYMPGVMFMILTYIPLSYLRLIGKTRTAMYMIFLLSGMATALSIIFAGILNMGSAGVALGISITFFCAFTYGQIAFVREKSEIKLLKPRWNFPAFRSIAASGSPNALDNILRAAQLALINLLFVSRSAEGGLAIFALFVFVMGIANAVVYGVSQSLVPLVGIAYGERDFKTVANFVKKTLRTGLFIIVAAAVALILSRNHIGRLFGLTEPEALRSAGTAFAWLSAAIIFSMLNNVMTNVFTVTKRIRLASAVVVCRLLLLSVIPAYALFGFMGEQAAWLGFLFGEALTLAALSLFIFFSQRRNPNLSSISLLDNALTRGMETIDFSVANTAKATVEASERVTGFCKSAEMDSKQAMAISLAIEELIILVGKHALALSEKEYIDIRIMKSHEGIFMRLRYSGIQYNPIERYNLDKDRMGEYMGLAMIAGITKSMEYSRIFGINNLLVRV